MLDNLYSNIGEKIKRLAKFIFIVEAILFIIAGILLLSADEDLALHGLLTLSFGPIIAWVSSWILYAFGELVEKTVKNEDNTRNILKLLKEKSTTKNNSSYATYVKNEIKSTHKWYCDGCKQMRTESPCEYCGKE